MTRYSCYEGDYTGSGEWELSCLGERELNYFSPSAPSAKRDNCDGTLYGDDEPWCCSISCTDTGGGGGDVLAKVDCSDAYMSCGNHESEFYDEYFGVEKSRVISPTIPLLHTPKKSKETI